MSKTDPIADYLTRIRNAALAKHSKVDIPSSRLLAEITRIFQEEGYILSFTTLEDEKQGVLRIYLKYGRDKKSVIQGMKRISSPGLRRYVRVEDIPKVLNGLGIAVLSTPKGILTDRKARQEKVGGEVLCTVW
jgi:small subunit ribosomal protein S8